MRGPGLRLRIFLLFAGLALGGFAAAGLGVWLGWRQLGASPEAASAFVSAAAVAGFGIFGLAAAVWLIFDERVAKPVERLAADLRARAHGGVARDLDGAAAPFLGDLGPAASALARQLSAATLEAAEAVARQTARLSLERDQLTAILTDVPVAVMMVNPAHQIVLYDGQSADLLATEAPPRLNASLFDYVHEGPILAALEELRGSGARRAPVVAETHSGRIYSGHLRALGDNAGYMLMLEPLSPEAERPITYDFDLLHAEATQDQRVARLRALVYVVFDTETTGLDPAADEVVQIGAVRIVNGRIVESERFDMLVDPGIPIPPGSTRIHGITDDMVAGAPKIGEAVRAFHRFCRGAVLVAHNAPFDVGFLRRYGKTEGLAFDHLVLDTVLLSAVLFGGSESHTLDALAERLGVDIDDGVRHTAIGDAVATAKVFVAALAMLEGRGLDTFGAVLQEARRHERIVQDLNHG